MSTAASVPSWVTAVNEAPASSPKKSSETIRRWPDEEIGRNSVMPCTRPRISACNQLTSHAPVAWRVTVSAPDHPAAAGPTWHVLWRVVEQRHLGRSGLRVSRLALGTMTWGRDTDDDEAAAQLTAFLDAGGNLVDTADVYADGASERMLGELLR